MSIGNKYGSGDCGCGQRTVGHRAFGTVGCCNRPIASPPEPCCEAHNIEYRTGNCYRPSVTFTAINESNGGFFLTFKKPYDEVPLNSKEVFFYHAGAGLIKIIGMLGHAYQVFVVDPTKEGTAIKEDDCVYVVVQAANVNSGGTARCLSGKFVAPILNGSETIYILNGSAISIGSTLTFTSGGETGSYVVSDFINASGSTYAYSVTNTGSGHTPGTIFDGGAQGGCTIPIEIVSEVDLCNLSASFLADHFTACKAGSPRGFVSAGAAAVPYGDGSGGWDQRFLTNLDCCVVTDGALKFTGLTCPDGQDRVILRNTNIACFEAAFQKAQIFGQGLPMNIQGFQVVATAYNSGTHEVTLDAWQAPYGDLGLREYPAGTQICIGDCCSGCLNGAQTSDYRTISPFATSANYGVAIDNVAVPSGVSYWLLGYNTGLTAQAFQLNPGYFAGPSAVGPRLPTMTDPLVLRQKFCNSSARGCNQQIEAQFNFGLIAAPLASGDTIDWEFAHYAGPSTTLADGVTPNPFINISTQQKTTGRIVGPTINDTANIGTSSFGFGNNTAAKVFPVASGDLRDYINLDKCSCAQSIVWCFVRITLASPTTVSFGIGLRRYIKRFDVNTIVLPNNAYVGGQGFAS